MAASKTTRRLRKAAPEGEAAVEAWVHDVNEKARALDALTQSVHPTAWHHDPDVARATAQYIATAKSGPDDAGSTAAAEPAAAAAKASTKGDEKPDALAAARQRLGMSAPLASRIGMLAVEALEIPDGYTSATRRSAHAFVDNLGTVGMLHPPAVEWVWDDERERVGHGIVIAGRRRVLAARERGDTEIACRIYDQPLTRQQRAMIRLSENTRRSPAWVEEVKALAELIRGGVALTEKEVCALLGWTASAYRERAKLALLPPAILEVIADGDMSEATAKKLTKLSRERMAALVARVAEVGAEALTTESVDALFREQTKATVATLPGLDAPTPPGEDEPAATSAAKAAVMALPVIQALRQLSVDLGTIPMGRGAKASMLAKALISELTILGQQR